MSKILRQFVVTLKQGATTIYTPEANTAVKITPGSVNTPPDSGGRPYQLGFNVKSEFTLMGNSNVDYAELFTVLLANEKIDVNFADEIDSPAEDLLFTQVPLIVDPVIDGDGKYEGIKCSFTRVMSKAQYSALHGYPAYRYVSGYVLRTEADHEGEPLADVTMTYTGVVGQVVTTDANGFYRIALPNGSTGNLTPDKNRIYVPGCFHLLPGDSSQSF
jgi:hypothetical protein